MRYIIWSILFTGSLSCNSAHSSIRVSGDEAGQKGLSGYTIPSYNNADLSIHSYAHAEWQEAPSKVENVDFLTAARIVKKNGNLEFSFTSFGQDYLVDLHPNTDFMMNGATLQVSNADGKTYSVPLSTAHVYKGVLRNPISKDEIQDSYARIVVQNDDTLNLDMEGVVFAPTLGMLHIKHKDQYQRSKRDFDASPKSDISGAHLIAIRDVNPEKLKCFPSKSNASLSECSEEHTHLSKRNKAPIVCGVDDGFAASQLFSKPGTSLGINKAVQFAAATACPLTNTRILAMGVAADCSYVVEKGGTSQALAAILSNWNTVSKVYESTFNVRLGVVSVKIQESCTPLDSSLSWNRDCSVPSYTISDRLSDFSKWRGQSSQDGIGLWHLMTKCSTQPAVGIAWVSQLCQSTSQTQQSQTVSGTGVSSIVPVEWKVVAHEIGHGFGAIHDCSSSGCSSSCRACTPNCDCKSQYLMNPLDNAVSDAFSPSSITDMCNGISNLGSCLQSPESLTLIAEGVCGNGIKEGNEQCDCGPSDSSSCAQNPCCDGKTCTLKPGKQCDPLNDACCSSTCSILPINTVCHKGDGICDRTVTCSGLDATCPFKTFIDDGTSCTRPDGVSATCASGICTSRDLQCSGNSSTVSTVSACPAFGNDCALNCQDKNGNCYQLTGNFLDGTTCGGSGRCQKGKCVGSTLVSQALLWMKTYPQYAYPILAGVGILILSIIWSIVKGCCCKPRAPKRSESTRRASLQGSDNTLYNQQQQQEQLYQAQVAEAMRQSMQQSPTRSPSQRQSYSSYPAQSSAYSNNPQIYRQSYQNNNPQVYRQSYQNQSADPYMIPLSAYPASASNSAWENPGNESDRISPQNNTTTVMKKKKKTQSQAFE